jgi:ATP-dependent Clp protease adaptor protein ClpS
MPCEEAARLLPFFRVNRGRRVYFERMNIETEPETVTRHRLLPPYHVLIENDDDHSQVFVVAVIRKVFGYEEAKAIELMHTAELAGEAVVWTGSKEVAELRLDQVRTFHEKHWGDGRDLGPLRSRIEPAH